jgi:hypothetical protein
LAYIVVTNSPAFISSNAPSITGQPQNQLAVAGSSATFNVQVSGAQPLIYQWRFNSNNISGATDMSYSRSNVQSGDAGYYDVLVTNSFGSAVSSNALLTIVTRPVLLNAGLSSNGLFGFVLSGDAGFNYAIEGTTNFSDWITMAILPNPLGAIPFYETNSPGLLFQAYRARLIP